MTKFIFVLVIIGLFTTGCQGIKETLSNKKKANSDEFLVKKKNPLVMPPEFSDLPIPSDQDGIEKKDDEETLDLSKVLKTSKDKNKINKNKSLEKSILKELNKN
jgi:hypothetical protein|tara:strand:- start:235 stop:546 length:312 start_codon:yes stop_codon:yes gene_type:complete